MIAKCSHCREIFNETDFDNHECDIQLSDVKNIKVIYFQDVSHGTRKLMSGLGLDGTLYRFEVVSRKAIPMIYPSTVNMKGKSPKKLPEPGCEILINLSERLHLATSKWMAFRETKF